MGTLVRADKSTSVDVAEGDAAMQGEQYLTFFLGSELFAICIAGIKEIIEYGGEPTPVPMMPAYLRGVINLRGRVVPVIDLMVRFGRNSSVVSRRTCIVILELYHNDEQQYLGVAVDMVKAVLEIADEDIEPPPSFGAKLRSDFIDGMGKIDGDFVIILDVEHVLSIDELSMLNDIDSSSVASPDLNNSELLPDQDAVTNNVESSEQELEEQFEVGEDGPENL
ncbi:MAG: chemotaxis protein CheW [Porticoccaceae bacterium]